ncbi:hypothetical protein CGI42_28305, partial [Vibrio parahaemolyticus]|uniref:hypothetical protein n=1 Tax=Vibrio parahaemolyticus TaxID=670 RepID=UPI00116A2C06
GGEKYLTRLRSNEKTIPVDIYRSLIKISLSTLGESDAERFPESFEWLRYGNDEWKIPFVVIRDNGKNDGIYIRNFIGNGICEDSP